MKIKISEARYRYLEDKTRFPYKNVSSVTLMYIHQYLRDKRTTIEGREENNLDDKFLETMFQRTFFDPDFIDSVKEFIDSKYLSDCFKENICYILNKEEGNEELIQKLSEVDHLKEISGDTWRNVSNGILHYYQNNKNEKKNLAGKCLNHYLFHLNSKGAIDYTKSINTPRTLATSILSTSGIIPEATYYNIYDSNTLDLNEEHLFSIYQKFQKFFPNRVDFYVMMVDLIPKLNAYHFINTYYRFVDSDFSVRFIIRNRELDPNSKEINKMFHKRVDEFKKKEKILELR